VRFLADESCDFRVVGALRRAGHDVVAVCEESPGLPDEEILSWAERGERILLAEDKDFGRLALAASGGRGAGVILIRCPESARIALPASIAALVERLGERLESSFTVWTPDRIRLRAL